MPEAIYLSIAGLVLISLTFIYLQLKQKKLDPELLANAKAKIKATAKLDPSHSILESHKILTNTVQTMFKKKQKLSAAKLFNKVSKRFKNEKEFWFYHRMRNRVAHETDFQASKTDSAQARKIFIEALASL